MVQVDNVAEWLRRQPAKLMGFARVGSNPTVVEFFLFFCADRDFAFLECLIENMMEDKENKNISWGGSRSYQQHSAGVCNTEVTCAGAR